MVEAVVVELVGDLEHDVAVAAVPDPVRHVDHRGAHGGLVGQDLVLPLVEAAEDDHQPRPVARLDDAPDAGQVRLAQGAVGLERRVHRPLVAGHAALEAEREGVDAVRGIVGHVREEPVRDGFRVQVRFAAILEDRVHHAHVHQQAFGTRAPVRQLVVDAPPGPAERDAGAGDERVLDGRAGTQAEILVPPVESIVAGCRRAGCLRITRDGPRLAGCVRVRGGAPGRPEPEDQCDEGDRERKSHGIPSVVASVPPPATPGDGWVAARQSSSCTTPGLGGQDPFLRIRRAMSSAYPGDFSVRTPPPERPRP